MVVPLIAGRQIHHGVTVERYRGSGEGFRIESGIGEGTAVADRQIEVGAVGGPIVEIETGEVTRSARYSLAFGILGVGIGVGQGSIEFRGQLSVDAQFDSTGTTFAGQVDYRASGADDDVIDTIVEVMLSIRLWKPVTSNRSR